METADTGVTLPESLTAALITEAGRAAKDLNARFHKLHAQRHMLRESMLKTQRILRLNDDDDLLPELVFGIDGAHVVDVNRATAYSVSCAVRVGPDQNRSAYRCLATDLPHLTALSTVSSTLMVMAEIMLAVETAEAHEEAFVVIDGSRISAIFRLNQFYAAARHHPEVERLLTFWRMHSEHRAGALLQRFESRNWLASYLGLPNIVGVLKLVTTDRLVRHYLPEMRGLIDDKTLAALVLEPGEYLRPVLIEDPPADGSAPYHMAETYPYHDDFPKLARSLVKKGPSQLFHSYYHTQSGHVIKLEFNSGFGQERFAGLVRWCEQEMVSVDLLEPYTMYVADRFAKEAVSVATRAMREIARVDTGSQWVWGVGAPYRTE